MAYAALFIDGFDHWAAGDVLLKWANLQDVGTYPSIISGRIRGSAVRINNTGMRQYLDPTGGSANYDRVLIGVAFRTSNYSAGTAFINLDSGVASTGSGNWNFAFDSSGHILIRRGGTTIATGTTILSLNTWYYLEFKMLLATGATGSYEVRINGVTELGPTSSVITASGTVNALRFTSPGGGSQDFDDLVVQDWSVGGVDFLGDVSVAALVPTGAGNYTQFTPSTGSNWQNVDDATPNGDTDYNASSTVGHKDSFAMSNLPVNGTPYMVQVLSEFRKDDAGSHTQRNFLRVGGTDYEGASNTVLDTYIYGKRDIWNSDPSGGAWDQTKVDALEAGYKVHA